MLTSSKVVPVDHPVASESVHDRGHVRWIDCAKGFGILLVVLGHTDRGLVTAGLIQRTPMVSFLDMWIYSFHMPLFFFLSGLFLWRTLGNSTKSEFASNRARTLVYPYFVWSSITILLKSALGSIPNTSRDISDLFIIFYMPIEQFWFLYVLLIITSMFGAMYYCGAPLWGPLAFSVLIYAIPSGQYLAWLPWQEACACAIYVAIGVFVGGLDLRKVSSISTPLAACATLFGFGLVAFAIHPSMTHIEVFLIAICGITASCAFAVLLARAGVDSVLNLCGRYSLEIFVAHTIASAASRVLLQHMGMTSGPVFVIAGVAAGLIFPIVLSTGLARLGVRSLFTLKQPKKLQITTPDLGSTVPCAKG